MREGIWAIIEASRGGAQPPRTLSTCSSSKIQKLSCAGHYTLYFIVVEWKMHFSCIIVFQISLLAHCNDLWDPWSGQYQVPVTLISFNSQLRFILALCHPLALSKMIRNQASRSIVEIWHLLRRFFIGTVITSKMITWRRNNDLEHYFWWREKTQLDILERLYKLLSVIL